jgi:hypothetical protein
MRCSQKPIETEGGRGSHHETTLSHPAFGAIKASRVQGRAELFGSDMSHDRYISVAINRAVMNRSLSSNWVFANDEVIEVALSEAQWATFVSAMNVGVGVPCTIAHIEGKRLPQIERDSSEQNRFAGELKASLEKAMLALGELSELATGRPLKAAESSRIRSLAFAAHRAISDSAPFVAKQFAEHMEEKTEAAKAEVHAMAMQVLAGVPLVANDEPKLIEHDSGDGA